MQEQPPVDLEKYKDAPGLTAAILHIQSMNQLVQDMLVGAYPHRHSREPRTLVSTQELDRVRLAASQPMPHQADGQKLLAEISRGRAAARTFASLVSTVQAALSTIQNVLLDPEANDITLRQTLVAVENSLHAELEPTFPPDEPLSDTVISRCYYPVEADYASLQDGDVLFVPGKNDGKAPEPSRGGLRIAGIWRTWVGTQPLFQVEQPSEADITKEIVGGAKVMRPYGETGVTMMRMHYAISQFRSMSAYEQSMGMSKSGKNVTERLHLGRAQGLGTAAETLTCPTWALPAIKLKPKVPTP